jgi:dTDP-4-amino-4,6-dideoxygalactose transaminase
MAENIGPGDEVITTPYTFFATVGAIARVGATPVFIDIDPQTYNLDANEIESKITKQTRAIIPVHLYGQMADMDVVMSVARKYGLIVIEDAAQAIGAQYKGRSAGSVGHYGCFSFFPSKNLGAAGDGGMVVTQDSDRADKLKCLRSRGSKPKYHHKIIGGNFRLDALQAAIIAVKLKYLDQWTAARQRNAKNYSELLSDALAPLSDQSFAPLTIPLAKTERHIFNQYVIRTSRRDQLQNWLKQKIIETEIYYPIPMHLQECFSYLGHKIGAFRCKRNPGTSDLPRTLSRPNQLCCGFDSGFCHSRFRLTRLRKRPDLNCMQRGASHGHSQHGSNLAFWIFRMLAAKCAAQCSIQAETSIIRTKLLWLNLFSVVLAAPT